MPRSVAHALRLQSKQCLEVARRTSDRAVRDELLSAAAWLHEEATKIEAMLDPPRGGSDARERGPDSHHSLAG